MVPCSRSKPMRDKVQSRSPPLTELRWHMYMLDFLSEKLGVKILARGRRAPFFPPIFQPKALYTTLTTYCCSRLVLPIPESPISNTLILRSLQQEQKLWNECTYLLVVQHNSMLVCVGAQCYKLHVSPFMFCRQANSELHKSTIWWLSYKTAFTLTNANPLLFHYFKVSQGICNHPLKNNGSVSNSIHIPKTKNSCDN